MRLYSVHCEFDKIEETKCWLESEGLTIFKVVDVDEIIPGLGMQVTHAQIIVVVPDEETESMLMLKYPYKVFERH